MQTAEEKGLGPGEVPSGSGPAPLCALHWLPTLSGPQGPLDGTKLSPRCLPMLCPHTHTHTTV